MKYKILRISLGKAVSIRYIDGTKERTLKCGELPRKELYLAVMDISVAWSEKVCEKTFEMSFPAYKERLLEAGEIKESGLRDPFLSVNRVDLDYLVDGTGEAKPAVLYLTGRLDLPPKIMQGHFIAEAPAGMSESLDKAIQRLLDEAERYIKGERLEETLPGLEKK